MKLTGDGRIDVRHSSRQAYELLAYKDLSTYEAYTERILEVAVQLQEDFNPLYEKLIDSWAGIDRFADTYKHRVDDVAKMLDMMQEARSKHSQVLDRLQHAEKQSKDATAELERSQDIIIQQIEEIENLKEQLKRFTMG